MQWIRIVIGLGLIPICAAATGCIWDVLASIRPDSYSAMPREAWALVIGFVIWCMLYLVMPRPVRTYVLAHELTHALWGVMMGARVSKMRVTETGGSVTLTKSNFLITLAPYFFPLYTVLVIAAYAVSSVFVDFGTYSLFWLALVGLSWGFHFTFTLSTLMEHQSDVQEYGRVFSYSVIYLLNVLGICIWIVAVTPVDLEFLVERLRINTAGFALWGLAGLAHAVEWSAELVRNWGET